MLIRKIAPYGFVGLLATFAFLVFSTSAEAPVRRAPDLVAAVTLGGEPWVRVESRANEYTRSDQDEASVELAADGTANVVWQSRRQQGATDGVYLRRFAATGELLGDETALNTQTGTDKNQPATITADGVRWAAWESRGADGGSLVHLRRLDHAAERRVTITEVVDPMFEQSRIALAPGRNGGVVAAWVSSDGKASRAHLREFDAKGEPVANGYDVGEARVVSLVTDRHGTLLCWQPPSAGVYVQRIGWGGEPTGVATRVDDVGGPAIEPALATGPHGSAVAWMEMPEGGRHHNVRLRRLGVDGAPLGHSITLNTGTSWNSGASVACFGDGRIVAAWNAEDMDSDRSELALRVLAADGSIGEPYIVSQGRLRVSDGRPSLAVGGDGRIVIAWSGDAGLGDRTGVHLTMLVPDRGAGLAGVAAPRKVDDRAGQPRDFVPGAFENGEFDVTFGTDVAMPHDPPVYEKPDPRLKGWGQRESAGMVPGGDHGFPGFSTGFRKLTPPDPHMAVGPDHIISIVNVGIGFWKKDGTRTYLANIDGSSGFWASVGAIDFVFDAEVHWDPDSERFFAMANERVRSTDRSYFLIAVSDDKDPNGKWHKYRVDVTATAGSDIDSPNLGIDDKAIYLTADMYGNKRQYAIYIMEKKPLLSGNPPGISKALSLSQYSAGIPVMWGKAPAMYMIRHGSSSSLTLYAIKNPLTTPTIVSTPISVPSYSSPTSITQRGTSTRISSFNARFWSCVWRDGSLWACHHQGSPVKARWYQIKTNNWPISGRPTLVQSGDVTAKAGNHASFNSIAVDEAGNALMTFADSGPNDYLSVARAWRLATDPKGTMRPAVLVKRNTAPYNTKRWGDYSAAAADPVDPTSIWYTHELAPTSSWTTWVGRKRTRILGTDVDTLSAASGGTVNFSLDNPTQKGKNFLMILTLSGTSPGFKIGGLDVPINIDPFTNEAIVQVLAGNPAFGAFLGKLGPKGNKVASLTLPPLPHLKGQTIHFCFVQDLVNWTFASPPAAVKFN